MTNIIDRLKEQLREGELERPTALVTEILGGLYIALLERHGGLMRSSNVDEFELALAALHGTLTEVEKEIGGVVKITRERG